MNTNKRRKKQTNGYVYSTFISRK